MVHKGNRFLDFTLPSNAFKYLNFLYFSTHLLSFGIDVNVRWGDTDLSFYAWMKKKTPKRNEAENPDSHLENYVPSKLDFEKSKKNNPLVESEQALEIQYELEIINQFKAADPIADFAKKYKCNEDDVVKMISEWKKRNRR